METLPNSLWPMRETGGLLDAFDNLFLLSYLVGLAVLIWVSWHRLFREPYSPIDDQTDKVLRLMPPGDLRGLLTVLRAYFIYCLLVGGLYSIIALAGSFIWDLAMKVRLDEIAGLSLPELSFEMDEPAWPLAVSLAFVGIFDRIPRVQQIELTFRRWAYRSMGIPPFIRKRTHFVVAANLLAQPGAAELFEAHEIAGSLHDLAKPLIGETRASQLRLELERLWIMHSLILPDASPYPSVSLRMRFAPMIREMASDARALLDETEGIVLLLGGRTAPGDGEEVDYERKERKRLIENLARRVSIVHWDMCTLMAVLVENDPKPSSMADPVIQGFVDAIHDGAAHENEEADRFLSIAFGSLTAAFLAAWIAIGIGVQATWGDRSPLVSASLDSLLLALVVLPALVAGLATQDARAATRQWVHYRPGSGQTMPVSQYVSVFARGFLATLPLLILFFAVLFFSTANTEGGAIDKFWDSWKLYLLYAGIGGLQAIAAAYTIGDVDGASSLQALRAAGWNALVVGLAMVCLNFVMADSWERMLENWFNIVRMALVCALAIYLTSRSTATRTQRASAEQTGSGLEPAVAS